MIKIKIIDLFYHPLIMAINYKLTLLLVEDYLKVGVKFHELGKQPSNSIKAKGWPPVIKHRWNIESTSARLESKHLQKLNIL